jgi:hypothetical protein
MAVVVVVVVALDRISLMGIGITWRGTRDKCHDESMSRKREKAPPYSDNAFFAYRSRKFRLSRVRCELRQQLS